MLSDFWNQGRAMEMAAASLGISFGALAFVEIASWTLPINTASQRAMEKLGFRYDRDIDFAGLQHQLHRLSVADWRSRSNPRVYDRFGECWSPSWHAINPSRECNSSR